MHVPDDVWCHVGALCMIRDTSIRRDFSVRRIQSRWRKNHAVVGRHCKLNDGRTGLIVHVQDHRVMVCLDEVHRKRMYLLITMSEIRDLRPVGEVVRETLRR